MPGTTPLGIHYPLMSEVVNASSWQTMATDIETLLGQVDALRDTARSPQYGEVRNTGTVSVATGVVTTLTWTNEIEDSSSLIDLAVNNDRITIGTGVWLVNSTMNLGGMTVITMVRNIITVNGTAHTANKVSTVNSSVPVNNTNLACVVSTAAGTILRTQLHWIGTGGPATGTAKMWALKLRDL